MSEDSNVTPEIASESEGLRRLKELEATGKYVFHGSDHIIAELEPRQAENNRQPDGEPAVCASKTIDLALFRAIFNAHGVKNISATSGWNGNNFYADQVLHDTALTAPGYVHVLAAEDFTQFPGRNEWRCTHHVKPLEVIEVSRPDFTIPVAVRVEKDKTAPQA